MRARFSKIAFILLACLLPLSFACSSSGGNSAPDSATEAYNQFFAKLEECGNIARNNPNTDAQNLEDPLSVCKKQVWQLIDTNTKNQFAVAYFSISRVDRIIEMYFDQAEHKEMRERTGTRILADKNIQSPEDLFLALFKPEDLEFNDYTKQGSVAVEEIKDPNAGYIVTVLTKAKGQEFVMIKERDGIWRCASLLNVVQNALAPVSKTELALAEYAKDNVVAEIDRRREVIEYANEMQARRTIRRQIQAKK